MNLLRSTLTIAVVLLLASSFMSCRPGRGSTEHASGLRPNILFVIADDQSFPHASAYGSDEFHTPNFDRVASAGVLFMNAFVAAPQCSPSRAAILTGRHIWQLEEAGTHSSYFPRKFSVFTDVLESSGYAVGFTGKGWGPGNWKEAGWPHNPAGTEYSEHRFDSVPAKGISKVDYATNFKAFLAEKEEGKPFFFWFGAHEPHRVYEYGSGRKAYPKADDLGIPRFLPRNDTLVTDWLDYAYEIEWFDRQLGKMLDILRESGQLENTLVVVTADNGMPFPYAKANLQEYGIHVPLAICGPGIRHAREERLVSLIDLAPTFLEVTGAPQMQGMSGASLLSLLRSGTDTPTDTSRAIFVGRERHTHARPDNVGFPARAIRTDRYLYIWNVKPDRWPVGDPPPANPPRPGEDETGLKRVEVGYEDVDDSPSKRNMLDNRERWPALYDRAFAKRQAEQLYDVKSDPACLHDLAQDDAFASVREELRERLLQKLRDESDPRVTGQGDIFDSYPRFGAMRAFPGFRKRGEYNPAFQEKSNTVHP